MVAIKQFLKKGLLDYNAIYNSSKAFIQQLKIKTPNENTMLKNLSGGNQQKVVIAKWLLQNCDILLVDEPTQGIDVGV